MLSSSIFIVLHFTFRSVIHFELLFVKGIILCREPFFVCGRHWFQHHLFENLLKIFAPLYCLGSFVNGQLTVFILYYSVSFIYLSPRSPISHCFDHSSFIVSPKVGQCHLHSKQILDPHDPPTSRSCSSPRSFPSQ